MGITPALRCLIGAILVKFGEALLFTWGKCNIYYYSYYKQSDPHLSIQYNTLPVAITAIPLALCTLASMRLARKFGAGPMIRVVTLIQGSALMFSFVMTNYLTFILFFLVINGCGCSLVMYPVLNCIWSYYPRNEGKVAGLIMGIFSLASILYILLITYLSNPDNEQATLKEQAGKTEFYYFDSHVADNVPRAVQVASCVSAACMIFGSLFVNYNEPTSNLEGIDIELQSQKREDNPPTEDEKPRTEDNEPATDQIDLQSAKPPNMKDALQSSQFIIFFLSQFTLFLFLASLSINYKSYSLSKYNNDDYVTLVDFVAQFAGGGLSFLWGMLVDRSRFTLLYSILTACSGVFALLLSLTGGQVNFTIFYIGWTICGKGALLVVSPGLVKIYKNELGTKLLTVLNVSTVLAFFFSPLIQLIAESLINFDYILAIYGVGILISALVITRMKMTYTE